MGKKHKVGIMLNKRQEEFGRSKVIAHRGAAYLFPENTVEAFELAISELADVIECDLRITADERLVISHDPTINRVTSQKGMISKLSLSQIRQAKIEYLNRGALSWTLIPTIEDLLTLSKGRIKIALELKDTKFSNAKYSEILIRTLRAFDVIDQVYCISFDRMRIYKIKEIEPEIKIGFITHNYFPPNAHNIDIVCALWPVLYINPLFVKISHQMGKQVWAMDSPSDFRINYYLNKKVDGILTYYPLKTHQIISGFFKKRDFAQYQNNTDDFR